MEIPENIKWIMLKLNDFGFEAFIIGGAVRDMLINQEPHDYDIFTNATGEEILKVFPQGVIIGGHERQAKILTVIVDGVEVSRYRSNGDRTQTGTSLKEHCGTCDFTINAMAIDVAGNLHDFFGGVQHFKEGKLVFVGDPFARVREDPLRILRGIRFLTKYNMALGIAEKKMFENAWMFIKDLPKERIREEVIKIMLLPRGIEVMHNFGLLQEIIPEFKKCNIDGGQHHNEKVHEHMILAHKYCQSVTDDYRIQLAALLHDIGKGATYTNDDNVIHFYQHEKVGAEYVESWMKEYKFSTMDIKLVTTLIRLHMWHHEDGSTIKTFGRKLQELKENGATHWDLLMVFYADNQGNLTKERSKFGDFCQGSYFLANYNFAIKENKPFNVNDLDIDGNIIMKLGFEGPEIGKIKNILFDEVWEGTLINRRDDLIKRVKNYEKQ